MKVSYIPITTFHRTYVVFSSHMRELTGIIHADCWHVLPNSIITLKAPKSSYVSLQEAEMHLKLQTLVI